MPTAPAESTFSTCDPRVPSTEGSQSGPRRRLGLKLAVLLASGWATFSSAVCAAERITVVSGPDAPKIEKFAAEELFQLLRNLTGIDGIAVADGQSSAPSGGLVLVGRPESNPQIKAAVGDAWPELAEQQIVLKSVPRDDGAMLVVGGGSPQAVLWAVYELGHRLGARYLPEGDLYPTQPKPISLTGFDVTLTPRLATRSWMLLGDGPSGSSSRGAEEQIRFLRQLAKMRFNRVVFDVRPWQPFVHYEFAGVRKQSAVLWPAEYPVSGETAGKKAFAGAERFENPDVTGETADKRTESGVRYLRGLIDAAHDLGMSVGLRISLHEFPIEFAAVCPALEKEEPLSSVLPGPFGRKDGNEVELARTVVRAYLQTYPQLDAVYLSTPGPTVDVDRPQLNIKTEPTAFHALKAHRFWNLKVSRQLLVDPFAGAYLDHVFKDPSLPKRDARPVVYTDGFRFKTFPCELAFPWVENGTSVLPLASIERVANATVGVENEPHDGFRAWCSSPGEHSLFVHYLSRKAWEPDVDAQQAITDLWTATTGNQAAAERLWLAWQSLDKATRLVTENDPAFAVPNPNMFTRHFIAEPAPRWWKEATDAYTQSMVEFYRAHGAIEGDAKPVLFYFAKRGEFILDYLGAVQAIREAALAKKAGDADATLEQLEKAVELTYNCINTLADVARSQPDRGLIAALNAFAYRPLLALYESESDE